jgi:hypothetical protein
VTDLLADGVGSLCVVYKRSSLLINTIARKEGLFGWAEGGFFQC